MSEPAILARNSDDKTEVFSMEDFESKLVSMRELYQEHKNEGMFPMRQRILVSLEFRDLVNH